jgi:general secretion pathway protein H
MAKKAAREMPVTSATGNSGFTLLELIVVLAILVLLAGAWPFAASRLFPNQQLRNEAQLLLSALRATRLHARLSGGAQSIEWTDPGSAYQFGTEGHDLPGGISLRSSAPASSSHTARITFYPDGSSSGGLLALTHADRSARIGVGSVTGHAEILE